MARNPAGTYSLPLPSVVASTVIDPAWANTTLADLAAEMTDSLSRSGEGGMLATLQGAVGALGGTGGYAFVGETNTGFFRAGAGDMRFSALGTERLRLYATGLDVGTSLIHTSTGNGSLLFQSARLSVDAGTDYVLNTLTTRSAGKLFEFQNNAVGVFSLTPAGLLALGGTAPSLAVATANTPLLLKGNRAAADAGSDIDTDTPATRTVGNLFRWLNNTVLKARVAFDGKGFFFGLDAGSQLITNVASPVSPTDAATRGYVNSGPTAVTSLLAGVNFTNGAGTAALTYYVTREGLVVVTGTVTATATSAVLLNVSTLLPAPFSNTSHRFGLATSQPGMETVQLDIGGQLTLVAASTSGRTYFVNISYLRS